MKSVLVPIDGSECSLRAVKYLIGVRESGLGPTLHLLNVQVGITGDVSQFVSRSDIKDYRREQSDEALRPARALLDQAGIPYETHVEVGHAADCITRRAEELQCDHIVMGTHGRSALADLLVASTTLKVLHQTRLPVLLVK
jgi:nucleotide-binding universal stress UspA family protein